MEKGWNDNAKTIIALRENEMRLVHGGGWIDTVVDLFVKGIGYFYKMGYEEARIRKAGM